MTCQIHITTETHELTRPIKKETHEFHILVYSFILVQWKIHYQKIDSVTVKLSEVVGSLFFLMRTPCGSNRPVTPAAGN